MAIVLNDAWTSEAGRSEVGESATPLVSPTIEQVAAEAYVIYQSRGAEHGRDLDDWLEAERRLSSISAPQEIPSTPS